MNKLKLTLACMACLFILGSGFPEKTDFEKGRFKNVCKDLRNDALLYFVFIDTKETSPWTEFDIVSTIDSIDSAIRWLETEAKKNGVRLKIKKDYYLGKDFATINRSLPGGSVQRSIAEPNMRTGIVNLNKWADNVARVAGESFFIVEKDGIPKQQSPRDKERLIAHLRDEFAVESVALLFMVNNYFRTDISIPVNTLSANQVEFAIVSYKYPAEIAHNFLHLYGAADLQASPYRRSAKKIRAGMEYFPNDIMQDPYSRDIKSLEIGDYTKYLIGWTNELEEKYRPLLTDTFANF